MFLEDSKSNNSLQTRGKIELPFVRSVLILHEFPFFTSVDDIQGLLTNFHWKRLYKNKYIFCKQNIQLVWLFGLFRCILTCFGLFFDCLANLLYNVTICKKNIELPSGQSGTRQLLEYTRKGLLRHTPFWQSQYDDRFWLSSSAHHILTLSSPTYPPLLQVQGKMSPCKTSLVPRSSFAIQQGQCRPRQEWGISVDSAWM